MRTSEIRALGRDELEQKVEDLSEEIFKLRCQAATVKPENVMKMPQIRRTVARIKTVLRELEMEKDGAASRRPRRQKRRAMARQGRS